MLVDLLAHAVPIFRIFAPHAALNVVGAWENEPSDRGLLRLSDDAGSRFELACDLSSDKRRRALTVEAAGRRALVNFADASASVVIDGREIPPAPTPQEPFKARCGFNSGL